MNQKQTETRQRLEQLLRDDEVYNTYRTSAEALKQEYESILAELPPEMYKVVVGYSECLKLMHLRAINMAWENMIFPTEG